MIYNYLFWPRFAFSNEIKQLYSAAVAGKTFNSMDLKLYLNNLIPVSIASICGVLPFPSLYPSSQRAFSLVVDKNHRVLGIISQMPQILNRRASLEHSRCG